MAKTKIVEKTKLSQSKQNLPEKEWYLIDAKDQILGRLATKITPFLMGKNKPTWQPQAEGGDNVVIINAAKIKVTGRKEETKIYYRYSGYPGGLKKETLRSLRSRKPQDILYHAISGMLPKNKLGRAAIKKLYIYPGEKHPHDSQKTQKLEV